MFVFNGPINVVDVDGKEGIILSGQPGGHKNKSHFLANGLDRAKRAKKWFKRKGEQVTWIVYTDNTEDNGHDPEMLKKYEKLAKKNGINFMVVSDKNDIVDYVNTKGTGDEAVREKDKISSFYYLGHATPGDLDAGYSNGSIGDFWSLNSIEPDDFNVEAFESGCRVNVVGGCRTSISGLEEDAVSTQFEEILDEKSTIYSSDVRTYYGGGVRTDPQLLEKNKGKIIETKGELPVSNDKQ